MTVQPTTHNLLNIENLTLGWEGQAPLFRNFNLKLERGQRMAIMGPNGSGKSTLLKAILGLIPIQNGILNRHGRLGAFMHETMLYDELTGREHLRWISKLSTTTSEPHLQELEASLGLASVMDHFIATYSAGQKQKLALLCTLYTQPSLLLLDEPTSHLDHESIQHLISHLNRHHDALLLVTHDTSLVEALGCSIHPLGSLP